jgi:hypothetical protein
MSILRVDIVGNADKLNSSLKKAEKNLKKFGDKATAIGKDLSLKLTAPIGLAGAAAIKFATDTEESLNKVRVAFGNSSKSVEDFADTSLESFGIARGSALDMAALFGDMSTSMGLTRSDAADLSTSLVGLAGDLASFKNINIEEVTTALSGVFTGETESLKRLGIVMTEVNLKQFAMEKGIQKNIKNFTQAEKVALRYQFVMEKTANAHGDFARTGGGAANQMRIFQESLKELAASFGEVILPTFTKAIKKVNGLLKSFKNLSPETKEFIVIAAGIVAAIGPALIVIGQISKVAIVAGKGLGVLTTAFRIFSTVIIANPVGLLITGLVALGAAFIEILHRVNPVVSRVQTFMNVIKSMGNPMKFASLQAQTAANNLKEQEKSQADLNSALDDYNKKIGDATTGTFNFNNVISDEPVRARAETVSALGAPAGITDPTGGFDLAPKADAAIAPLKQTNEEIGAIFMDISDSLSDGFAGAIEGIVSGNMTMGGAFGALMGLLGDVAIQIGKTAIKIGIGMIAIKKAFANPVTAIAAGAALVALGAVIKNFGASFGGGGGGEVPALAQGGIVSAPTLAMVGDNRGAGNGNPEVIAPLNKLEGMMGGQNINVGGQFRVEGQDLVLALQRADRNRNRIR